MTHCRTQLFSGHNLYPTTSHWWHVTVQLFHCTSNICSYQDPYNYYTPPTAPLISLPYFHSLHQPDQHIYVPPNLYLCPLFCILLGFLKPWKIHAPHSSESHEPLMHVHSMASPKTRTLNIRLWMETSNLACCYPLSTRPIINREDFNDKVNSSHTENNFKELKNYPMWPMHKQTYCSHVNLCHLLTNQWYYTTEII